MERVEEVLERLGIKYDYHKNDDGTWYGLVEFWTDTAGQDIPVEIDFDGTAEDFVEKFAEYADNYDVDENVELFVGMRGKQGVPNTVRELLDDCQEAKDTLMKIKKELEEALFEYNPRLGFIDDVDKMRDVKTLTKEEFLESYSYLTEEEYDETKKYFDWLKKEVM